MKKLRKYNYVVKPRFFGKTSIAEIERSVKKMLLGGVKVVCVFDADVTTRDAAERKRLESFKQVYARNKQVVICDSMPSLEFWFLLHFILTTRHFGNADEVITELRKYIPGYCKTQSFLENPQWVENMCGDGQFGNALNNARRVIQQKESDDVSEYFPFTKVHLGIERLEELKNRKE